MILDDLGEKNITIIIRIIRACTTLVSNSFKFNGNPKQSINTFWNPAKIEGITDDRGTSVDYFLLLYPFYLKRLIELLGESRIMTIIRTRVGPIVL